MPLPKSKSDSPGTTRVRSENDGQGIQVLSRAVDILRVVGTDSGELSLGKIALRVGLPRSTVQRIVNALLAENLLSTGPDASGYRIGSEIQQLAEAGRQDVPQSLHPLLETLSDATGETVDLAICRNRQMVFVDQVAGKQRLRAVSAIGEAFPMSVTANGKAVLALKTDEFARQLCDSERESGILVKNQTTIARELKQIRKLGYGVDESEHTPGIAAVGIAFKSAGAFYALSIPAPASRFASSRDFFVATLLQSRDAISRSITDAAFV